MCSFNNDPLADVTENGEWGIIIIIIIIMVYSQDISSSVKD